MPGHNLTEMEQIGTSPVEEKTYLYRLCRPDEEPSKGLEARDPSAHGVSISSHLRGKRRSPYISTTATIECVQMFIGTTIMDGWKPGKVVRIDLDMLKLNPSVEVIDLCNPDIAVKSLRKVDAKGRANIAKYKEVLLKGKVPADCIEVLEDIENEDRHETDDYTSSDEDVEDQDVEQVSDIPAKGTDPDKQGIAVNCVINGLCLSGFENENKNSTHEGTKAKEIGNDMNEFENDIKPSKPEEIVTQIAGGAEIGQTEDGDRTDFVENHDDDLIIIEEDMKDMELCALEKSTEPDAEKGADIVGTITKPRNSSFNQAGVTQFCDSTDDIQNEDLSEEAVKDQTSITRNVPTEEADKEDLPGPIQNEDLPEGAVKDQRSITKNMPTREADEESEHEDDEIAELCGDKGDLKSEQTASEKKLKSLAENYKSSLEAFIVRREGTIEILRELVDQLNACRVKGNITKISGAGVSIAGAIAAVASIPLTGGLSAMALTAGSLFGIGGGIAGIGGDIYVNTCENDYMKRANHVLKRDHEEAERLNQIGYELKSHVSHMSKIGVPEVHIFRIMTTAYTNTMALFRLLEISETIAHVGKVTKHAASGLAKAGHLAKGAGAFVSVVFVPLDIWQIVNSSWELQNDSSEKAQMIENVIKDLEKDLAEKKTYLLKRTDAERSDDINTEEDNDSTAERDDDQMVEHNDCKDSNGNNDRENALVEEIEIKSDDVNTYKAEEEIECKKDK